MATDLDIVNAALSHIGEDANVAALSPPDGSVQGAHCARFWPIARAELQEVFDWSFNEYRDGALAPVTNLLDAWLYAYALPADCIKVRKVMAAGETDERTGRPFIVIGVNHTLFTNEENPIVVYSKLVTDPSKFTPAFVAAAGYQLAGYLCGPILKKPAMGQQFFDMASQKARGAAAVDANASVGEEHDHPASWMTQR